MNQPIQVWRGKTIECPKRHDRYLVVDPLWQTQPVEYRKGIGDAVITTPKAVNQTSGSIKHGLELAMKISW